MKPFLILMMILSIIWAIWFFASYIVKDSFNMIYAGINLIIVLIGGYFSQLTELVEHDGRIKRKD